MGKPTAQQCKTRILRSIIVACQKDLIKLGQDFNLCFTETCFVAREVHVYAMASRAVQRQMGARGKIVFRGPCAHASPPLPRLELTSAHMATNVLTNVKNG